LKLTLSTAIPLSLLIWVKAVKGQGHRIIRSAEICISVGCREWFRRENKYRGCGRECQRLRRMQKSVERRRPALCTTTQLPHSSLTPRQTSGPSLSLSAAGTRLLYCNHKSAKLLSTQSAFDTDDDMNENIMKI